MQPKGTNGLIATVSLLVPWCMRTPLLLSYDVVSEHAGATDLDFDHIARDHVAVRALDAHPQHVAGSRVV
jgi:hypothetical protein